MNTYDLKCYKKTYQDPHYWDKVECSSQSEQDQHWANCRHLTDRFYQELLLRGYLIPRSENQT